MEPAAFLMAIQMPTYSVKTTRQTLIYTSKRMRNIIFQKMVKQIVIKYQTSTYCVLYYCLQARRRRTQRVINVK